MTTNIEFQNRSIDMDAADFKASGYLLVDQISRFLEKLPTKPVTRAESPAEIRSFLGNESLPDEGAPATELMEHASELLFEHSLFNGHPRFWGYVTSSPAPIGALADMLAASVNANVGAFSLSPMATEIERQTVKWLAEFVGYPSTCEGLFVSGGNAANFIGFLTARKAMITRDIRKEGLFHTDPADNQELRGKYLVYCAKGTHTWIQKATDLFGLGTDCIRWIAQDQNGKLDCSALEDQIERDSAKGHYPFLVVANAGSVGTGVVDNLEAISGICQEHDLWFHVDGAYGAPAAGLPENAELFKGLALADSVALDPHKWFYSPIEAGCILVRQPKLLTDAFSYQPEYYNFDGDGEDFPVNFYDYGLQNSRGFKALKVWLSLQQAGRNGYIKMIREDIELAQALFKLCSDEPDIEAVTHNLSITNFRYKPKHLAHLCDESHFNRLNENLLNRLQSGGEVYPSNAIVDGKYCLRVCIVNFRTTLPDLEALLRIVLREGDKLSREMWPELASQN